MDIEFKIHDFEGPLDLLLHLIKISEMDIMDIKIDEITNQYMSFIEKQEKMNLEISSEYLVLASELLVIKSKMLLPINKMEKEEIEEDPREELVNRLLEYQTYKDITKILKEKEKLRKDIYTKQPENYMEYKTEEGIKESNLSIDDLVRAITRYYQRKNDSKPLNTKVTVKEISISSRRHDIRRLLSQKRKMSFFELFPIMTKEYVVATFLAILEMAKNKEINIVQEESFSDIICEVIEDE